MCQTSFTIAYGVGFRVCAQYYQYFFKCAIYLFFFKNITLIYIFSMILMAKKMFDARVLEMNFSLSMEARRK